MSKGGGSPPLPDFGSLIPLQANANASQFETGLNASRVNSITPWGSTTWYRPGQTPGQTTIKTPAGAITGTPTGMVKAQYGGGSGSDAGGTGAPGTGSNTGSPGSPGGGEGGGGGGSTGSGGNPYANVPNMGYNYGAQGPGSGSMSIGPYGLPNSGGDWGSILGRLPDPNAAGPWTAVTQLSPEQQKIYNQQVGLTTGRNSLAQGLLRNSGNLATPENFADTLPTFGLAYGSGNVPGSRDASENAYYSRASRYFDPQVDKDRQALQDRLVQQGLNVGDPGYLRAMSEFEDQTARSRADMRDQAILGGDQAATNELQRVLAAQNANFGQSMQRAGVGASDRSRQLSELAGLISGQGPQQPQSPLALGQGQPGGVDILSAANQNFSNALGASNAGAAQNASMWNGLLSALAMYAAFA